MSPDLTEDIRKGVYPVRLRKGEIIQTSDDHVDGLFFVEKGLAQLYRVRGNKKHITRFIVEDQFIVALARLFGERHKELAFWIEALEDCTFWHFPSSLLDDVTKKHVAFHFHTSTILLKDQARAEAGGYCQRLENDTENYYQLREHFPYLFDRVPIANLAEFTRLKESVFRHLHSKSSLRRH